MTPASPFSFRRDDGLLADPERARLVPERQLAQHSMTGTRHDEHRHERQHEEPAGAREHASLRHERHRRAVLEQLEGQQVGVDVVADALDRRWFDVYLKTTSKSTPVTAATSVAESQPGSTPIGASSDRPRAFATAFSQTTICVRTSIIRCIPGREAGRTPAPRPHSTLSRLISFSTQSAMNSSTLLYPAASAARLARS